ncbi:MAG: hypothetical protein U0V72_09740 [Cytophagales bacterium]
MKHILLIAFVLLSFRSSAHQDIVYSINKGNVHLQYLSGWGQLEVGNKIRIFLELSDKLIKEKFPNSEQLYIYFGHDYTKSDTTYYTLGYGQFSFWDYEKYKTSKDVKANGLKILIRDRDFDIKKMLQLVNSGFANIDFIKRNQSEYIIKTRYYKVDTLKSIQFNLVAKYLSTTDATIEKLLQEKHYRNREKAKEERDIDYYFQNNKFHFYNTRKPKEEWSESQGKYVVSKTFGEDILTIDNIFEIFGSVDDGHFVFTNDSTFYFIPQFKAPVRGPFKIDSIASGRPPITKYYHEYRPIEKFILFIDNYRNYEKALFIPDSNFLVSNYDKIENDVINGLFKKTDNPKIKNSPSKTTIILIVLLVLCLTTIIWLIRRQKSGSSV